MQTNTRVAFLRAGLRIYRSWKILGRMITTLLEASCVMSADQRTAVGEEEGAAGVAGGCA